MKAIARKCKFNVFIKNLNNCYFLNASIVIIIIWHHKSRKENSWILSNKFHCTENSSDLNERWQWRLLDPGGLQCSLWSRCSIISSQFEILICRLEFSKCNSSSVSIMLIHFLHHQFLFHFENNRLISLLITAGTPCIWWYN